MTITYRGECIINDIKTIKSMLSTLKDLKTRTEHTNEIVYYLENKLVQITQFVIIIDGRKEPNIYILFDT